MADIEIAPDLLFEFAGFHMPTCVAQKGVQVRVPIDLREDADEPHGRGAAWAFDDGWGFLVRGRHKVSFRWPAPGAGIQHSQISVG